MLILRHAQRLPFSLRPFVFPELIALTVCQHGYPNRHKHRRDNQYQDSTAERLKQPNAGPCSLGIAEGTILGKQRNRERQHPYEKGGHQDRSYRAEIHFSYTHISFPSLYGSSRKRSSRKLSHQIMFIM